MNDIENKDDFISHTIDLKNYQSKNHDNFMNMLSKCKFSYEAIYNANRLEVIDYEIVKPNE